jgi:hypothetical protein
MKNKNKLSVGLIIIVVLAIGIYFRADISGFAIQNVPGDTTQVNNDEVDFVLLNASMVPIQIAEDRWVASQKYALGDDTICIKDCAFYLSENELTFYKAYVRNWGTCMCKYYAE